MQRIQDVLSGVVVAVAVAMLTIPAAAQGPIQRATSNQPLLTTSSPTFAAVTATTVTTTNFSVGGNAITIAGAVTVSGANALTVTTTGTTAVTLPTAGVLAAVIQATSGSIGGGALAAGACASGTVVVTGATSGMNVTVSPVSADPTNSGVLGVTIFGRVTATDQVTVYVCAPIIGTPTAFTYRVTVTR